MKTCTRAPSAMTTEKNKLFDVIATLVKTVLAGIIYHGVSKSLALSLPNGAHVRVKLSRVRHYIAGYLKFVFFYTHAFVIYCYTHIIWNSYILVDYHKSILNPMGRMEVVMNPRFKPPATDLDSTSFLVFWAQCGKIVPLLVAMISN